LVESVKQYEGEIEWIFAENGCDQNNLSMYRLFDCERKKIVDTNRNWGINVAFNDMYRIARGEFCVEMENDWFNQDLSVNWLSIAKGILMSDESIALVQLRSIYDQNENWGVNKKEYNPWSCGLGKEYRLSTNGYRYLVCRDFYGYNHNPHMIRKRYRNHVGDLPEPTAQSDPRHGETLYQELFLKAGYNTAHINTRLFEHVGGALRKQYEAL